MVVAIDGPAGVGKSTISRKIAESSGFFYLNSGEFYRAVTFYSLSRDESLEKIAEGTDFTLEDNLLLINGKDLSEELHTDEVDSLVAQVSSNQQVRKILNIKMQKLTEGNNIVAEGRDMTTVVFPHAEIKIFLDADVKIRAERRFNQGTSDQSLEELIQSIKQRDEIDRNKEGGSLIISEEAWYLDTSGLTIEQVCEKVLRKIHDVGISRRQ
jgi:cytidylate kinase